MQVVAIRYFRLMVSHDIDVSVRISEPALPLLNSVGLVESGHTRYMTVQGKVPGLPVRLPGSPTSASPFLFSCFSGPPSHRHPPLQK